MNELLEWAADEFGQAQLGDVRRSVRLVGMAAASAEHPHGLVTQVFRDSAEREAAFRFLESRRIDDAAVAAPMFAAAARRCVGASELVVAMDQSTVSVVDKGISKGLGRTCTFSQSTVRRGLEVMSAMAVVDGQSVGLLAQQWLRRNDAAVQKSHHDKRPIEERESDLWRRCLQAMIETLQKHAPNARPWVQMDRGADISHVLLAAAALNLDFTVRSSSNRRLEPLGYMREEVQRQPALGTAKMMIPDTHAPAGRPRVRPAKFVVRASRLPLRLQNTRGVRISLFPLTVVHIRETSTGHRAPIEWYLLTNREATSFERKYSARDVLRT